MGRRFGAVVGGIRGLLDLLGNKQHREALEADLIERGLRLRDVGSINFDWRDLWVVYSTLPPSSALHRALGFSWTDVEYLLAQSVDALTWLAWAQSEDGSKNRNRPDPVLRPGQEPPNERIGGGAMTVEEANEWLGEAFARQPESIDDGS